MIRNIIANPVPPAFVDYYREYINNDYTTQSLKIAYYLYIVNNENNAYGPSFNTIATPVLLQFYKNQNMIDLNGLEIMYSGSSYDTKDLNKEVNIVGFFDTSVRNGLNQTFVASDSLFNRFNNELAGYYSTFIGQMPSSESKIEQLVRFSYDYRMEDGTVFDLKNRAMVALQGGNSMIETLSKVFLYVALGLAVFAGLMLANFIYISISNKKREIGILRAVGAKARDVFTIFFSESFIITMINLVLAIIGAVVGTIVLNNVLATSLGLTLLAFGVRHVSIMLVVSVVVAFLASFFPVYSIARKQPIDSIQGR